MSKALKPLTQIKINNLGARDERYEVADAGQRGLKLVVFPSGAKSFVVRYKFGGRKRKLTLGGVGLAAARKAAGAALYEVHEGRDPAEQKKAKKKKTAAAAANTVEAVLKDYLKAPGKRGGARLRRIKEREQTFERLVYPEIGSVPIGALQRDSVIDMLDKVQRKCGDCMAERTKAYLSAAFTWYGEKRGDFVNPVGRVSYYDGQPRDRVLDDDELRKLWAATAPDAAGAFHEPFHALVRFLLLTAARRSEAALLTWPEITEDGTRWELPAARNKAKFNLPRPLSQAAQDVLNALPAIDAKAFVFTNDGRHPISLSKPMAAFLDTCGVENWTLHDLRRTARTLMSRAKVSADDAERCLGHKLPAIRGTYDWHDYLPQMQDAYNELASLLDRIVNPPASVVTPMRRRKKQLAAAS